MEKSDLEFKKHFINLSVDKYFVESINPITNLFLTLLGKPTTKEEMKRKLLNDKELMK